MVRKWRQGNLMPMLTLIFVSFASLLLVRVGALAYYSGRTALRAAMISSLRAIANEKEEELDNWVLHEQIDLVRLALSPVLRTQLAVLGTAAPNTAAAREAHRQLLATLQPGMQAGPQGFLELFVLEPQRGQIVVSTDPAAEGTFKQDRPYFIHGKDGPYMQSPYYSSVMQGPAMTAAVPVRSAAGELLGVLGGRLALHEINAMMQRSTSLYRTLDVFLVNTANLFVTQPRYGSDQAILRRHITRPEINHCLQGENGTVLAPDYRDVPAVIVYRWLPAHRLCLKAKLDQAEVFAPIEVFGYEMLAIGVVGLLSACALALRLARGITRPVQALQQGAVRFGQGELDVRLPETTGGELGGLAREFNRMAAALAEKEAQLHAHAGTLKQQVAERTAALHASEAELRAVFAAMPDAVLVLGREGRLVKVASANPALLPKPPAELIGQTVHQIYPLDQADAFVRQVQHTLDVQHPTAYEYEVRMHGRAFWFAATLSPMSTDAVVWVARDLTERKRMEEELRRSNADLEQFAYVASHDLQEPLRMVSNYLQLLERRYKAQLDADAHEFIAYAVDGASRMRQLISDLLAYSRVGRQGKALAPTDGERVLEQVLNDLHMAIAERGAEVTHDALPTVMADNLQLAQLLQNLIGNALKFCSERQPKIHLGVQRGPGEWVFSVQDNGIGIDPAFAERIFMIFQRLHGTGQYPGTGIGLAVCKKIVEHHGGRIWVESEPGQGAKFYFTIPDATSSARGGPPWPGDSRNSC